jgi:hypothetical protein
MPTATAVSASVTDNQTGTPVPRVPFPVKLRVSISAKNPLHIQRIGRCLRIVHTAVVVTVAIAMHVHSTRTMLVIGERSVVHVLHVRL